MQTLDLFCVQIYTDWLVESGFYRLFMNAQIFRNPATEFDATSARITTANIDFLHQIVGVGSLQSSGNRNPVNQRLVYLRELSFSSPAWLSATIGIDRSRIPFTCLVDQLRTGRAQFIDWQ